jgi:hypothetical protein
VILATNPFRQSYDRWDSRTAFKELSRCLRERFGGGT